MPAASPDAGPTRSWGSRILEPFARVGNILKRIVVDVWESLRFVPFALYIVLAVVGFWLWAFASVVGLVRFAMRLAMVVLLWLSGSVPSRPGRPDDIAEGIRHDVQLLWDQRLAVYEELARPLARHIVAFRRHARRFGHWSIPRQSFAILVSVLFVGIPAMYVVPRSQDVQITDDNVYFRGSERALAHHLVHAVDLQDRGKTREYLNEDVWWLGKLNSQGLQSQLEPGRYYRLRIIGLRWYKFPTLFPTILDATEIDEHGEPIEDPSRLIAGPR